MLQARTLDSLLHKCRIHAAAEKGSKTQAACFLLLRHGFKALYPRQTSVKVMISLCPLQVNSTSTTIN